MSIQHFYRNHVEIVIWEGSDDHIIVDNTGTIKLNIEQGSLLAPSGYYSLIEALEEARQISMQNDSDLWRPDDVPGTDEIVDDDGNISDGYHAVFNT